MKISFVIPCYRSEHTLPAVVAELKRTMAQRPEYDYEIILTEDGSPDGVWRVICGLAEEDARVRAIRFTRNFGQHAALMAGLSAVSGDAAFLLDDDGQAPVDELFKLIDELEKGYDVVYGVYPEIRQNAFRRFGTWMNKMMAETLLDWPKDLQSTSFFVCRRLVVEEMLRYDKPYPYLEGLIIRATRNIGHVLVHQRDRAEGTSGYTLGKLLKLWLNGFTAFSVKPLRIASVCGMTFALLGFVWMLVIVIQRLVSTDVVEGWATIVAVLLLIGGMLMLMLGLIGEYIGRIYICINNSPQYVVRECLPADLLDAGRDARR
ncbi:MAG: glycosyltransferase family 2 protein [Oscillospiraceae bacterium]|nr:glycosyltransferase family 2 protein [Oscillospiraceae bacterium]